MHHGVMANTDVVADDNGDVGRLVNADSILYVHTMSHADGVDISTEHCSKPDGAVVAHCDIAYESCVFGQEASLAPLGSASFYCFDECHVLYYLK